MKKAILNMLMLFAVTGVATAQTVTVADVEALPGETGEKIKATIELSAPAGKYTGVQLSIQFPTTGFSNVLKATGTSFETCQVGAMIDGLVKIAAANTDPFENATIEVKFDVDGSLDLGEYPVMVSGQFEATGVVDPIADVPFKVIVTDRITLDENSTELPIARTGVNVKVKRTIKKDEWSTLCLPFDMTKEQVLNTFGDDVKLAYFEDYDVEKEGSNVNTITVNFEEEDLSLGFSGNYPYLIKISKDVTEFTVDGVNIDPDEDNAVIEYTNGKNGNKKVVYGTCKGIYQANTTVPENSLFLSGNQFWYSTGKTKMKAFRAYFTLQDILTDKSVGARINITDDETTGIKEVHRNANVEGTYDLQGRKVEEPANKGLYIVNGHKVVIK